MKNIIKICTLILTVMFIASCEDEDKIKFSVDDIAKGALGQFTRTTNDAGFVDLTDVAGTTIEFTIDLDYEQEGTADGLTPGIGTLSSNLEFAPVSVVDIEVLFIRGGKGLESGIVQSLTSWPATITLDPDQLMEALPSFSTADLALGDALQISAGFQMESGVNYPAFTVNVEDGTKVLGYSPNFGSFPGLIHFLNYAVSCRSNIPLGSYSGVTTGPLNPATSATVTLTAGAVPGQYAADDLSAGMLAAITANPGFLGGGTFQDVCNVITVPTFAPPGLVNVTQWADNPGSYDPLTGIIVINWDIIGFQHTTTLTPQ